MEMRNEHVYYLPCNFCNTFLAVNVPCTNSHNIVTIRCGHCSGLQSVSMRALMPANIPIQTLQQTVQSHAHSTQRCEMECGSSSSSSTRFSKISLMRPQEKVEPRMLPANKRTEKRQRVPSAYNQFIKEEIQRIKASNPEISHKEAFSTAAKNWAHFPHIQFGIALEGNKRSKIDDTFHGGGSTMHQAFR